MAYGRGLGGPAGAFIQGLQTGIPLAGLMAEQRNAAAMREANSILADWEGSPDPYGDVMDPSQQALAEPGQTQSYDPAPVVNMAQRYREALVNVDNPAAYGAAVKNYDSFVRGKVTAKLAEAVQLSSAGNSAGANNALGTALAYADPSTVSEVQRDPESGAFLVANYKDGKPISGYAATPENIQNALAFFTTDNPAQTYFGLLEDRDQRADRAKRTAQYTKESNANIVAAQSKEQRYQEEWLLNSAIKDIELETARIGLEDLKTTHESKALADQWTNYGTAVTQKEEARKAVQEPVTKTLEALNEMTTVKLPQDDPQAAGEQVDMLAGALTTDDDGNKGIADSWWTTTNSDGYVEVKPEMATAAATMAADIHARNPETPVEVAAGVIEGSLGRSQSTQVTLDEDGGAWLTTPSLDQLEVGEDTAAMVLRFRRSMAEPLMEMQQTEEGQQRVAANTAQTGIPAEAPAEIAPEAAAAAPVPGTAAAAPPTAPPTAPAPALAAQSQTPPAAIPAPAQAPVPPPPVDDTVARSGIQGQPAPEQQSVVMSDPHLMAVAQQWVAAGQPNEGPEAQQLARVIHSLPPYERLMALRELGLMPGGGGGANGS